MSLAPYALITDTEEVWAYLNASTQDRETFEPQMEGWINGASLMLEQFVNRPIMARTFDYYQNGNGRVCLYLDYYPVIKLHEITVATWDLLVIYTINIARSAKQFVFDPLTGKMTLLPFSSVGYWLHGQQNVHLVYDAGFTGYSLEPFKDAVKELIAIRWREVGVHPLELVRSDNIGNNVSFTKFDPRRLPHITQQTINAFKRVEV